MAEDRKSAFWGNFGLTDMSRHQLKQARAKQMYQGAQAQNPNQYRPGGGAAMGHQLGSNIGAMFGGALNARSHGLMTKTEENLYNARDQVDHQFTAMEESGELDNMSYADKELLYQEKAEEAFGKFGLHEQQYAMNRSLEAQRKQKKMQELKLAEAGLGVQVTETNLRAAKSAADIQEKYGDERARLGIAAQRQQLAIAEQAQQDGQVQDIYREGTNVPESARVINGVAHLDNGEKLGLGEWANTGYDGDKNALSEERAFLKYYTPGWRDKFGEQVNSVDLAATSQIKIMEILSEAQHGDGGAINIMGSSGKVITTMRNIADSVRGVWNEGGQIYNLAVNIGGRKGADGRYKGGKNLSLGALASDKNSLTAQKLKFFDEAARGSHRGAAQYRAAILDLAYATARAAEPGARQLSDYDIARALERIGGSTSDPEGLRMIFRDNMFKMKQALDNKYMSVQPKYRKFLIPPDQKKVYDDRLNKWSDMMGLTPEQRAAGGFGTAQTPTDEIDRFKRDETAMDPRLGTVGNTSQPGTTNMPWQEMATGNGTPQKTPEQVAHEADVKALSTAQSQADALLRN